jgi:glycosyltransferase involved in cell wall biosynthesis
MRSGSETPLVSVIVTFYNLGSLVAETLDCVLSQTYPAIEVIAVDDGSTDDTAERCRAFGDRIVFVHRKNGGSSAARNSGIARARGSLVAHLDGDDLWEPDKLEIQVDAVRRFPEAGLIVTDGIEFSEQGLRPHPLLGPSSAPLLAGPSPLVPAEACHAQLIAENFVATPSQIMLPARVLREIGPWNETLRSSPDYELYLRVALRYPWVLLRDKLVRWRYSPAGVSGNSYFRGFNWVSERPQILRAHLDRLPPAQRPHVRAVMNRSIHATARAAYHVAHKYRERRWATRYLLGLMRTGGGARFVLPYLLAIWTPAGLLAGAGRVLRQRP